MSLAIGTKLGPYEVVAPLGAGGMGEVYKARDTRLDRTVAIKVLTDAMATEPSSRERFEREAKAISALNHPNICVLHDVGRERPQPSAADAPPVDFLVMEYLEGETLAARLSREPAREGGESRRLLPLGEVLGIAVQVAAALDRAHRQGIVHRDLKPGNVMLVPHPAGTARGSLVKLLDFGLARLTQPGTARGSAEVTRHGLVSLSDLSAPTVSSPLTLKGTVLGTLQYMAPEQIEGREADTRTDIFAFGSVLYEMLTGTRPFEGRSQASLIGAILDQQPPPVASVRPDTPPLLDEIVARSLAKDPDDRWQTARDLMRQLEWVGRQGAWASAEPVRATGSAPRRPRPVVAAAALVAAALAGGGVTWFIRPAATPDAPTVTRFTVDLPEGQAFTRTGRRVVAMSPDGSRLAYVANRQIYVRALNDLGAEPLAGTEESDPSEPVFAPDGQWIAFWSTNALKKVPITGGTPTALAQVENPFGASWTGNQILLGQETPRGIVAVPAEGGPPITLIALDATKGEWAQSPHFVAGQRAVLFTLRTGERDWHESSIVVQDLQSGARTTVLDGGTDAQVLPTGHLVFARDASLFAVGFDEGRSAVTGSVMPVQSEVQQAALGFTGAAQLAWSRSGSLVFVPDEAAAVDRGFLWMDRHGRAERSTAPPRPYGWSARLAGFSLSSDGARVATLIRSASRSDPQSGYDAWVWEVARGALTRLSFTGTATNPVWSGDGQRVCYASREEVLCQGFDGSGSAQSLLTVPVASAVRALTADGARMILATNSSQTRWDISTATIAPPHELRPLIQTPATEIGAALSPDGRWLAYQSDESGRDEVYVRPFPAADQGRWQVSTAGGDEPRWSRDGRELFYLQAASAGASPDITLMSVPVAQGAAFVADTPRPLLKVPAGASYAYDVASDGRFLFNVPAAVVGATAPTLRLIVVQHWHEELKRLVPIR